MTNVIIESTKVPSLTAVPGPPPHPLLGVRGNAMQFIGDPISYTAKLFKVYGPIVSMVKGGRGVNILSPESDCPGSIFIMGPELSYNYATQHEAYRKYALTGMLYKKRHDSVRTQPLQHFLTGLFDTSPDEHRKQRRMLMPAFSKKRIESYHRDMVTIAQDILDTWQDGQQINLSIAMRILTARVSAKTFIGQDTQADDMVRRSIATLQRANKLLSNPLTSLAPLDIAGLPYHRFLDVLIEFDKEMRAIIARKQATETDTDDILSVLLSTREDETGRVFSEQEVLGHIGVIFSAAYETSSNTIDWTLLLLSQFPHVAAQVLDELESVLHGDAPSVEQLAQLVHLEHVIKESLRLIPTAPLIWKALTRDTEVGGYILPAKTVIYNGIYHTHHMPELYPHPDDFRPERWETINPSIAEYSPFGGGSRMCIGASFAMMEVKTVLAMLLQRFRLQCLPNAKIDRFGFVTIAPRGGLHMTIHKQDRQFKQGVGGIHGNIRQMVHLPA